MFCHLAENLKDGHIKYDFWTLNVSYIVLRMKYRLKLDVLCWCLSSLTALRYKLFIQHNPEIKRSLYDNGFSSSLNGLKFYGLTN